MTDTIKVYAIGSKVELIHKSKDCLTVIVIAIGIYPTGIQYKVVWMDGNQRRTEWVETLEIGHDRNSKIQEIGFEIGYDRNSKIQEIGFCREDELK